MERIDDLQVNGLKLIQDSELFCFGCDAVELANFVTGLPSSNVCDLGCGSGIIPVLLAGKRGMSVTGVELQEACVSLARRSVDIVTCNPPYRKEGSGFKQERGSVALARHEIAVTLAEAVHCASRLTKSGGKFFTVCHIERLAEMISLCTSEKLEPKILQILRPCDGKPPHLFLLKCIKDAAPALTVLPERAV